MAERFTTKQLLFVEEYLACGFNATEAARRAGYKGSDAALAVIGHRNLRKAKISVRLKARIAESAMTADEVLARLSDQATASLVDFVTIDEKTGVWNLDLAKAQRAGKVHLIKKLWRDASGNQRFELIDAQAALQLLGRHHKLFADRIDLESGGRPLVEGLEDAIRRIYGNGAAADPDSPGPADAAPAGGPARGSAGRPDQ